MRTRSRRQILKIWERWLYQPGTYIFTIQNKSKNASKAMKITDIVTQVNTRYGAPMGRPDTGHEPYTRVRGRNGRICKIDQVRIYDKRVPMSRCGAYDIGGAYWGTGPELRVRFTKDLTFIQWYRIPQNSNL